MTQIVRMKAVLENRTKQTLTDEKHFESHYPVYIENDKLYELRPLNGRIQGFQIDPDTLFDIDGVKTIGNPVTYDQLLDLVVTQRGIQGGFGAAHDVDALTANTTILYPNHSVDLVNVPILVKVTLTSVEILDLNSTPIQAVAAPGAGKIIQVVDATARLNFNSAAYATNTGFELILAGATDAQAATPTTNTVLAATATKHTFVPIKSTAIGIGDTQLLANAALNIQVPIGDPVTGDSTVDVWISYIIKTL